MNKRKTQAAGKGKKSNLIQDARQGQNEPFDVAIIGGGYAGLSAALLFGRYLIPTIIFDGGTTRNFLTSKVHGYLGFENASPKKLIKKSWQDVLKYTSVVSVKEVVKEVKKGRKHFILQADRIYSSKYVLIATGVQDVKPKVRNFAKFDGNGAWHCPHCDGFETKGKKLVIISAGPNCLSYAKEFLGWTKDITVFVDDNYQPTEEMKNEAQELGIDIIQDDKIIEIVPGRMGEIAKVACKSGKSYDAQVVFYHLGYRIQNELAKQLGCALDEGYVAVNENQQTTIDRVYAAGDIDTDRHYVILAASSGAVAAMNIYQELLKMAIGKRKSMASDTLTT